MPYEIFISYSRDASEICDDVVGILTERLGYAAEDVFCDRTAIPGGSRWWQRITEALGEVRYVLLLGTREAAAKPDMIRRELEEARHQNAGREQQAVVVPVEFDAGAVKALLGEGSTHYIAASRHDDRCDDPESLERALRRALVQRLTDSLTARRGKARAWAVQRLPLPSFWEHTWDTFVPDSGVVALVGPGGRGKSVIAAHYVDRLLENPAVHPFLLEPDDVARGADALARELGARSPDDLPGDLQSLHDHHGKRVVFVVDALDQVPAGDDPRHEQTVQLLKVLEASADAVLITCRDDVWAAAYASSLPFPVQELGELEEGTVAWNLRTSGVPVRALGNTLLRSPFFLDLALRRAGTWDTIPAGEIAFLRRLFHDAVEEGGPVPDASGRRKQAALAGLAEAQLSDMGYAVPRATVHRLSGLSPTAFAQAVSRLKNDRLMVERRSGLRLSHDLLDAYAVATTVFEAADQDAAARALCGRLEQEIGWPVVSMLVALAHEQRAEGLLRTLFTEFLHILDRKGDGDAWMARAWGVTYVLRERLPLLMTLVLEVLKGSVVKRKGPGDTPSRLGDRARVTQEAASSLASSFGGLEAGDPADAPHVVPVLAESLDKFPLRARFVEALAKYRTAEVRAVLVDRGDRELTAREDLALLRYIARALRVFEPDGATTGLLGRIIDDPGIDAVTRRRAHETLRVHLGRPEPPCDEAEFVEGLRTGDKVHRYSDWDVVREYAAHVRDEATHGRRFGPAVVGALIRCFEHEMSYVGCPAAIALGCLDDDAARDALLEHLLRDVLTTEVRAACLDALRQQYDRTTGDPARRRLFAFQLLHAAHIARHRGAEAVARGLADIVGPDTDTDTFDVLPYEAGTGALALSVHLDASPSAAAVDPALRRLEGPVDGPDREAKYRFTGARPGGDGRTLDISLAPTTWTEARRFHSAVRHDPGAARHTDERHAMGGMPRWIRPVPLGDTVVPGIACVHCVVLSSDRRVLFARRGKDTAYAPGRWSAGFEEQLNSSDTHGPADPFLSAACRGFREEFGVDMAAERAVPLSLVMEIDLLNLALVVLLRPDLTADEITEHRRSRAPDAWEAETVVWVPLHSDPLADHAPAHPTTALRWGLLQRWLASDR